MIIEKLRIINFKLYDDTGKVFHFNEDLNIIVGNNDTGKSTILDALQLVTTGKISGVYVDRALTMNLFNMKSQKKFIDSLLTNTPTLPEITIEIYGKKDDRFADFSGSNNTLGEDCPGMQMKLEFDETYATEFKDRLLKKEITQIPIEYYKISKYYFSGIPIEYRKTPFKTAYLDASRNSYSRYVYQYVDSNIADYLDPTDKANLSIEYRSNRDKFAQSDQIKKLNESLQKDKHILNDKSVSIDLYDESVDEWKKHVTLKIDENPIDTLGYGTQNSIKIELALRNNSDLTNLVLIEEPENNLSYVNMSRLIKKIVNVTTSQIFITTHSSFVANKSNLGKLIVLGNFDNTNLLTLSNDTKEYFKKLPGYDTLRIILSEKAILVEGPSDELIVQRAYKDIHGKLPIEDGIDVISVDSLAFKRYLEIALKINKKTVVVTDNDSDIDKNIIKKYADYIDKENITFCYETDEKLHTLETSLVEANIAPDDWDKFKLVVSKNNSMINKSKKDIISFMKDNKTEWSFRVFDSKERIKYPEYILNAIK
ncbi:MAG: AAA family ATPase [Candidatus Cloacimonetes bacterium]|nr:AAA family ATPase [Candidatus Cloacimonadota bacterium]